MISFTSGKLRSASIVALATAGLAGTSALAAHVQTPAPAPSTHSQASTAKSPETGAKTSHTPDVKTTKSPDASESPEVKDSPDSSGDGGAHGACVAKVAEDHTLVADNGHGHKNHGAAVRKAAHDCPK